MSDLTNMVDILLPPHFKPSGKQKTIAQTIQDGDWIGGFHLWIYTKVPQPMVLLQVRSAKSRIAPGKLDVGVGGHYDAGEQGLDGLREAKEELGLTILPGQCHFWGVRLFVDIDEQGRERKFAMSTYLAELASNAGNIMPQPGEVSGAYWVPLKPLLEVLYAQQTQLVADGIDDKGQPSTVTVKQDAFYHNPDNYHLHMLEHIAFKLGLKM